MAALGGKFTTVEGILTDIKDLVSSYDVTLACLKLHWCNCSVWVIVCCCSLQIVSKNPFLCGDSSTADRTQKLKEFGQKIDKVFCLFVKLRTLFSMFNLRMCFFDTVVT